MSVGFDTFSGLPEDWNRNPMGTFNVDGVIPKIDIVFWKKGLFQDTLPDYLANNNDFSARKLDVHLDADLYRATTFVLNCLQPHLKSGDILLFDD